MLDPQTQIFCDIYRRTEQGMVRQGQSPRYTMMTLLGLHRYEQAGQHSPIATEPILDALLRDLSWVQNTGDLGLLLWTCAEIVPEMVPAIYRKLGAETALGRFQDGRKGYSMEVAWYLTGLAFCQLASHTDLPGLMEQAAAAQAILQANCGPQGIYGHMSRRKSTAGFVRGGIGTFADQVYPTIAYARWSQATGDVKAREAACRTAQTICGLQGPQGEWFWRYVSGSGTVISRYPIYSVHQHAMAPMMLQAASEATGEDFSEAIDRGLAWINGDNELERNFIEPELNLVWRSIFLSPSDLTIDAGLRYLGWRTGAVDSRRLQICYECRPYELGWLLYAFSGR
jgi:hypothetical protein